MSSVVVRLRSPAMLTLEQQLSNACFELHAKRNGFRMAFPKVG